jgi:hypothetical protein
MSKDAILDGYSPVLRPEGLIRVKLTEGKTVIWVQNPNNYAEFRAGTVRDLERGIRVMPVFAAGGFYTTSRNQSCGLLQLKQVLVLHSSPLLNLGGATIDLVEVFGTRVYTEFACVVCIDVKPGPVFPCGHQCVCADCAAHLPTKTCPMCRAPIP